MRALVKQFLELKTDYPVFANQEREDLPRDREFIILRWGEEAVRNNSLARGPVVLTVWAHCPVELGTDFTVLDDVLTVVKEQILDMYSFKGFGWEITGSRYMGAGGDLRDSGYNTITKNMTFEILSHRVG